MTQLMTIGESLVRMARRHPNRVALLEGRRRLTYTALNERANRMANALLGHGLRPGDRVGVLLPNSIEYLEAMYGVAKAGMVLVPINARLAAAEIEYLLSDSGARALICTDRLYEALADVRVTCFVIGEQRAGTYAYEDSLSTASTREPDIRVGETDMWALAYTSGTTGRPKGAMLTHRSKILSAMAELIEFRLTERDVLLLNSPLFHAHGLVAALIHLCIGGTVVVGRGFEPERDLELVQAHGVTTLSLVPTMYHDLLETLGAQPGRYDLRSLSRLRCTGAPLPEPLKLEILDAFPAAEFQVFYGCTEGGAVSTLRPQDIRRKAQSVGQAFFGMDVAVLGPDGRQSAPGVQGRLFFKGPTMFSGYYGRPAQTAAGFYQDWFSLGDLATQDEEGFLFLEGREHDVIISGGENIYPREVEDVLAAHPAVLEAAVVGVSDPRWGEIVKAVVILEPGQSVGAQELIEWCQARLARYKRPQRVEFRQSLPRNAMGKIIRQQLLEG